MRYDKGHKATTRRRILDTAAARFRRDGIDAVGVAEVMGEAGLTHGGFYSHFKSKEDLVRATMEHVIDGARERFRTEVAAGGLEGWMRHYLRASHRDHPERGCLGPTLVGELIRHSAATRLAVGKWTQRVYDSIGGELPAAIPAPKRREAAAGIFAAMIGAIQLARVAPDEATADLVLEAGLASALKLAGIKPRLAAIRN
jgi:TetR/AcrR family transcriptional repressor of nem operon